MITIQQAFDLAVQSHRAGQLAQAEDLYRQIVAERPDDADALANLGDVLRETGRVDEAIAAYRQCIALRPESAEFLGRLGVALKDRGQLDEAIAAYRRAIVLSPDYPEACGNLGNALYFKGELDEAIAAYRQAIRLAPGAHEPYSNLGSALKEQGRLDEAIALYRQALALDPGLAQAHSNLIYTMHFHPGYKAETIAEECRRWDRQHARVPRKSPHPNDRNPDGRLRIAYVSPDFRDHAVGRNILPLIRRHDRGQFHVSCYAQVLCPDAVTGQFKLNVDQWRSIVGLSDDQAAEQIRQDRIDILIDLALHTGRNRLLVFARKPAPVQATFAGYPGSTGLTAIDYRLSDPYLDPLGMDESIYSERTVRLPDSFWCYDPLDCRDIPVNPLPALSVVKGSGRRSTASAAGALTGGGNPPDQPRLRGDSAGGGTGGTSSVLTFGCLNNFCKINEIMLGLWAQVLRQISGSRLLLLAMSGSHRQRTLDCFRQEGIDPARVEFIQPQSRRGYLQQYHRIDLGLDSFPYNGHTTSLDSFWMGVPVITLVGSTAVSRAGWCQLSNLGLAELAGRTPEQFVTIAVKLARDLPRLQQLRATLRPRMECSPLMEAPRFARNIEAAYRRMWRTWCEAPTAGRL